MRRYVIQDSATVYTRISKADAKRRFERGEPVVFCPVKLRPGFPFAPHCTVTRNDAEHYSGVDRFDTRVNEFEYYNCGCNETGTYTAFYVARPLNT